MGALDRELNAVLGAIDDLAELEEHFAQADRRNSDDEVLRLIREGAVLAEKNRCDMAIWRKHTGEFLLLHDAAICGGSRIHTIRWSRTT